jgi:hypothetical protein
MNAEQNVKIESALESCLAECGATDRPYSRISKLVSDLRNDPGWTFEEIDELQTRVTRRLLYSEDKP